MSPLSRTFVITACFVERLRSLTPITADLNGPNRVKIDRQRKGCSLLTPSTGHVRICVCVCWLGGGLHSVLRDSSTSAADDNTSTDITLKSVALLASCVILLLYLLHSVHSVYTASTSSQVGLRVQLKWPNWIQETHIPVSVLFFNTHQILITFITVSKIF